MKKVLAVLIPVAILLLLLVPSVSATWCDANYGKKAPILINNTGGSAQTYYQVELNYTHDSDMNSNFSDIMIYNESDCSLIPFWNESAVASSWNKIWFNCSNIPASSWTNDTYYLYYNYSSASSASAGDETYGFFDDFDGLETGWISKNTSQTNCMPGEGGYETPPWLFGEYQKYIYGIAYNNTKIYLRKIDSNNYSIVNSLDLTAVFSLPDLSTDADRAYARMLIYKGGWKGIISRSYINGVKTNKIAFGDGNLTDFTFTDTTLHTLGDDWMRTSVDPVSGIGVIVQEITASKFRVFNLSNKTLGSEITITGGGSNGIMYPTWVPWKDKFFGSFRGGGGYYVWMNKNSTFSTPSFSICSEGQNHQPSCDYKRKELIVGCPSANSFYQTSDFSTWTLKTGQRNYKGCYFDSRFDKWYLVEDAGATLVTIDEFDPSDDSLNAEWGNIHGNPDCVWGNEKVSTKRSIFYQDGTNYARGSANHSLKVKDLGSITKLNLALYGTTLTATLKAENGTNLNSKTISFVELKADNSTDLGTNTTNASGQTTKTITTGSDRIFVGYFYGDDEYAPASNYIYGDDSVAGLTNAPLCGEPVSEEEEKDQSLDTTKWDVNVGTPIVENGYVKLTVDRISSDNAWGADKSIRMKVKIVAEASTVMFGWADAYGVHQEVAWHRTGSTEETATRHGGTEEDNAYDYLLDEKVYDIHRVSTTSVEFKRDDATLFTHSTQVPTGNMKSYFYTSTSDEIWCDWVFVRKYASPEPTAQLGAEESSPTTPTITLISQTPATLYQNSTGNFNVTWLVNCSGGLNPSSVAFIYTNYYMVDGSYNHSIRVPSNDRAAPFANMSNERILRADNRNGSLNFEGNATITGGNVYEWGGGDENTSRMTITAINSTHTHVYWNGTLRDTVFPNMFYLDRTEQENATMTQYGIYKDHYLLAKIWNVEAIEGHDDYIFTSFADTHLGSISPNKVLEIYYLNESYNPAGTINPEDSLYSFYLSSHNATSWVDYKYSPHNSTYIKAFTVNQSAIEDAGIEVTKTGYLYYRSSVASAQPYYLNLTNSASSCNRSFAENNVAYTGSSAPFSEYPYTPNIFVSDRHEGHQFQMKLFAADNNGFWGNSSLETTNIGVARFPPTTPSISHFNYPIGTQDYDMNGTYANTFDVGVGVATDPDGGTVTHNLTLHYANETIVAIINNTFTEADVAPGEPYALISFNSTPYYSLTETYTMRVVATDDEGKTSQSWLGVNFSLVAVPYITSWWNDYTKDNSTSFVVGYLEEVNRTIFFNVTANQSIDYWIWYKDGVLVQNSSADNYTASWDFGGDYTLMVYGINAFWQTSTLTWGVKIENSLYEQNQLLLEENKMIGMSVLLGILIIVGIVFFLVGLIQPNSVLTLLGSMTFFITMTLPIPMLPDYPYFGIALTSILLLFGLIGIIITFWQFFTTYNSDKGYHKWDNYFDKQ